MGVPTQVLSLCSGYGGLDLGVRLATGAETVCYVEREAYAAATLVARMADEALGEAPIWDDVKTFDGEPWCGKVDCITAGYPCQPFSHAGRRGGVEDERHIWPDVCRIVATVRPVWCFFENVEGHLSLGFREVVADLHALGYVVEAGLFTASEVGASHRRKRLFILAHRDIGERVEPGSKSHEHRLKRKYLDATVETWATPEAGNAKRGTTSTNGREPGREASQFSPPGHPPTSGPSSSETTPNSPLPSARKRLNPTFVGWLMGLPTNWCNPLLRVDPTSFAAWETGLFHLLRQLRSWTCMDDSRRR